MNVFSNYIRNVTEEDRENLPRLSYSSLEVFKNCPYQFNMKYNEKKRANETTLALELGSILHKVLEELGKYYINNTTPNFEELEFILHYGVTDTDEKTKEQLLGIDDLKRKYFEEWFEKDNASGMDYSQKMNIFKTVLKKEMTDQSVWHPLYTELPFEFVYKDRAIFIGFIDRVDINGDGDYKTIDYKSSKKIYDKSKTTTSLQFGIYALAILNMFGKLPIEFEYRFITIDQVQTAMTSGWEKRLEKQIDKTLDNIDKCKETGIWIPSPTPLCHWCYASNTNPKAVQYKNECEYYSLWTPTEKNWDVNKRFNALDLTKDKHVNKIDGDNNGDNKKQRKLIF